MSPSELVTLDRESVTVWPCLREDHLGNWVLRFGGGVYGRSNSVQPFGSPGIPMPDAVEHCEAAYREEGIRPMFRLAHVHEWERLDRFLEERGYELSDPSLVMINESPNCVADPNVELVEEHDADWYAAYLRGSGRAAGREEAAEALIRSVGRPRRYARMTADGETACVGLGAVFNGTLWLFGLATEPHLRGQGLASRLVSTLVAWGSTAGARRLALQVAGVNDPAIALYRKLGYATAYEYHYRRL